MMNLNNNAGDRKKPPGRPLSSRSDSSGYKHKPQPSFVARLRPIAGRRASQVRDATRTVGFGREGGTEGRSR